ncbi:MAG: lytic transglycosylase domain-containing protein [Bdellovibrionales bacterium]|nr:lytic transglycosylase domain-containing protein [Bdellovibrionales bacterium]
MKYLRLTCLWGAIFFGASLGLSFGASAVAPFLGYSTDAFVTDRVGVFPTFRFYRGGAYASITESTLSHVFEDRLRGVSLGRGLSKRLAHHLYELCVRHRMDPAFVLSVIQVESSFRADAVSSAGAVGLMQLMPGTARRLGARHVTVKALQDPFLNLELGVTYLRNLRVRYAGLSAYYPLAAYNLGPHRLDTLRAKPTFKPEKTLRYYEEIMRGVGDWRRYGSQAQARFERELSTMPARRSALKAKPDVQSKPVDPA